MADLFRCVLRVQGGIDAATGWLVVAAAAFAFVLAVWRLREAGAFAALGWFGRLKPLGKFAAIAVFCALVWRGGAKNDGDRGEHNPVNPVNPVKNNLRDSTNFPLAVTAIAADNSNRVVDVGPVGGISPVFGETTGTTGKNNIKGCAG